MVNKGDFFKYKSIEYILVDSYGDTCNVINLNEGRQEFLNVIVENLEPILRKEEISNFFEQLGLCFNESKDVRIGDYVKFKVDRNEYMGFIFQFTGNDYEIIGDLWNTYITNYNYKKNNDCISVIPLNFAKEYLAYKTSNN